MVTLLIVVVIVAGVAIGLYAMLAPRRADQARVKREGAPLQATTDWTNEAGDEFAGLTESARCDMIFAVGALDDERSQRLLEHALSDPSEAVSLAAAHVLISSGRSRMVESFLKAHPGQRADRIAQTLSLLDSTRTE
jgi:hypothetical protein